MPVLRKVALLGICLTVIAFASSAQLYINEFMLRNQTVLTDDFGETDDWVEIYNDGSSVVNMAGYYFSDDPLIPLKFQIPTDQGALFILPGDYLIFWTDKDPEQGIDHIDFKLSSDGEMLSLTSNDGVTLVDEVSFPAQAADVSYGRNGDAASDWIFFSNSTPEASNTYIVQDPQVLFINEVLAENTDNITDQADEYESWFEVYNPLPNAVNLADYRVRFDGGTPSTISNTDPTRTVIAAGGFIILWVDGDTDQGSNHVAGTLAPESGLVELLNPLDDGVVSAYEYSALAANMSWGRSADGGSASIEFNIPTPRVTNSLAIVEPELLYINELMADNFTDVVDELGIAEDWIEIYNPNPYPVNLAGYHLSDNPDVPNKFEIPTDDPAATTVAANDWILFWADEDAIEGPRHVSFKLSAAGEQVTLYSTDAFTVADQITYFDMPEDTSYGRAMDGSMDWVLFSGTTPDASNNNGTINIHEAKANSANWIIGNNPVTNGQLIWNDPRDIRLYDLRGSLLNSAFNATRLNVSDLPVGTYILQSDQGEVVKVIVGD